MLGLKRVLVVVQVRQAAVQGGNEEQGYRRYQRSEEQRMRRSVEVGSR